MEKNTKTILLAVFILLIAIVSFNFTGMTGEIIKSRITSITPYKTYVIPSETVILKVIPGSEGVDADIDIYNSDDDTRYAQKITTVCRRYKCEEVTDVKIKIRDDFKPGTYYFRVYDLYSKSYVKAYFTVGVLYPKLGPEDHN